MPGPIGGPGAKIQLCQRDAGGARAAEGVTVGDGRGGTSPGTLQGMQ